MINRFQRLFRVWWPDLVALAVLALLVIIFFWKMVFTRLILPRGDAFTYFYPYWEYRNAALRSGHLPLWNPYLFMGVPFLANSQAGVLYPPNWLVIGLDAPTAVKVSLILHLIWAALGSYLYARRVTGLSILGATVAGLTFALGGYLTAQVEHINQLQGLAWLPWLFWLWSEAMRGHHRALYWLSAAFALQLLAGHSQTAFISGAGLGTWAIWETVARWREWKHTSTSFSFPALRRLAYPLGAVAIATLLAAGLAAAQLVPTLELARLSNRSGGLSFIEAVSFSFKPHFIGRGLLPSYGPESLFSEYVAFIGVTGLLLALIGGWARRHEWHIMGLIGLCGLGLFLALGAYNPVYWLLVRAVSGFDLFRAPARWLALSAFGAAILVGVGIDCLRASGHSPAKRFSRYWPGIPIIGLMLLAFAAPLTRDDIPGATYPQVFEVVIWLVTLAAGLGALEWQRRAMISWFDIPTIFAALLAAELFLGSRNLPYNHLSTPQVWTSQRPAISALLAAERDSIPPARYLSMSDTLFDPGDLRELEAAYGPHLTDDALYDFIVGTKQKEILAPNLSLAWGIPAMDGFDGGLLPTRDYTRFTGLFLGEEEVSPDGRLRENLESVPDLAWLRLANVRWIITDKVFDAWVDGVYYDLQFPYEALPGQSIPVEAIPILPFEATTVGVVGYVEMAEGIAAGTQIGSVAVYVSGEELPLVQPLVVGEDFAGSTADMVSPTFKSWPEAIRIERVEVTTVSGFQGRLVVRGVTLIDNRTGAFMATTLSQGDHIRLAQSGDVKLYEFVDTLPRAYLVCDPVLVSTQEEMWVLLAEQQGRVTVIEESNPPDTVTCDPDDPGTVEITTDEAETVWLTASVKGTGVYLVLLDAWYPDWLAYTFTTELGEKQPDVRRANGLFRAIPIPSGEVDVMFVYHRRALLTGLIISAESVLILLAGLLLRWSLGRKPDPDATA